MALGLCLSGCMCVVGGSAAVERAVHIYLMTTLTDALHVCLPVIHCY